MRPTDSPSTVKRCTLRADGKCRGGESSYNCPKAVPPPPPPSPPPALADVCSRAANEWVNLRVLSPPRWCSDYRASDDMCSRSYIRPMSDPDRIRRCVPKANGRCGTRSGDAYNFDCPGASSPPPPAPSPAGCVTNGADYCGQGTEWSSLRGKCEAIVAV